MWEWSSERELLLSNQCWRKKNRWIDISVQDRFSKLIAVTWCMFRNCRIILLWWFHVLSLESIVDYRKRRWTGEEGKGSGDYWYCIAWKVPVPLYSWAAIKLCRFWALWKVESTWSEDFADRRFLRSYCNTGIEREAKYWYSPIQLDCWTCSTISWCAKATYMQN